MPPRKGRRNSVSSDAVEQVTENMDAPVRRSTRKRKAEEVEVEPEEIVSEALSDEDDAGSSSRPVVISSSSKDSEQDVAGEVSEPEVHEPADDDAVEVARRFDQDEEYARQLQEEEYAAAGAIRDPFAHIARRVVRKESVKSLFSNLNFFTRNLDSTWVSPV